ncbi:hypothetical protein [Streptomyces sp. MBT53]|uniref:hypothetical protein n=1 Tax=Streptomyces sp. MBT53 TaxID=1488384 RepID=UPI001912BAD6|nr:hypothetical protein [Streptomyces sp. MBT53]MBK6014545.1 hypothetical protein [Streptomyces sp. MBT53]
MSGADVLLRCADAAPTFGPGTTPVAVVTHGSDQPVPLPDRRARETREASDVRY